jgi:hypothetical protein
MSFCKSSIFVAVLSQVFVAYGDQSVTTSPNDVKPSTIPSLNNAGLISTPPATSPAGIAASIESQAHVLQVEISKRMAVLTNDNPEVREAVARLEDARSSFAEAVSKIPEISALDGERNKKVKEYAELETRFNRFRIHWMTHNKPVRRQDGSLAAERPQPLRGCSDCQKDFDRFVSGDPQLLKSYESNAAEMLVDLQRKRAELLPLSVGRSAAVKMAMANNTQLQELDAAARSCELKLNTLYSQDKEITELRSKLHELHEKMVSSRAIERKTTQSPRSRLSNSAFLHLQSTGPCALIRMRVS